MRTALMLPHQARYTLLDLAGAGVAFPMRRYLPLVSDTSSDVRRDLDSVMSEIQRIIATYLDAQITSFEHIPQQMRVNERFHFVFAADFPNQYDRRAIEALQSIGNTGTVAGVYLFIHHNTGFDLPRDISMSGFNSPFTINPDNAASLAVRKLVLKPDAAPSADLQARLFEKLTQAKPPTRIIEWDQMVGLDPENWWKTSAAEIVTTPVGAMGKGEALAIWFGVNRDGQPCVHGALAAMPGAGKSNLYHVLITGLATRYSPEELRLYLIDGKNGVEFQPYRHLPHVEVVSLRSSPELSRSVLAELLNEMNRRSTMFEQTRVQDLIGYRSKGQPLGKLPRILLFVDEYQQLFEDDTDELASQYLRRLSEQGRFVGIHMFLASQRFDVAGMLNKDKIFGNIHLRAAMQMSASDVQTLTEFGRRGKGLIATNDLPGKIVINDRAGEDGANANSAGKVAFLTAERRDQLIAMLVERASALPEESLPRRVVFNGREQPLLTENPEFESLLDFGHYPTTQELETAARKAKFAGGLDITDWFLGEKPYVAWLGQEYSVRGQSRLIFRRRTGENALIIGATNPVRYGMLCSLIASLCVNAPPSQTRFAIVDRSNNAAQWGSALQAVYDRLLIPAGFGTVFSRDGKNLNEILDGLIAAMDHRRTLPEDVLMNEPSLFAIFTDLDTLELVRRKPSSYGAMANTPDGDKLTRLYTEGAPLGIHVILSFAGVRSMATIVDERRALFNFRHRVALQMSDDDSHTFIRSRKAATLQLDGGTPISAVYLDTEYDRVTRFKPYTTEPVASTSVHSDTLLEQLDRIGKHLASRQL
jgi:S-DNA-T family DNA segregation ATPase FtsK/SpoIIIE